MKSFVELGITPSILKALEDMGFSEPTPVQEKAIPHILNHEDLIVRSKTGSGKTAVFGVSILQLIEPGKTGPQGLILTPTRELAVQVDSDLKKMSAHLDHQTTAVYGQHSMNVEIQALKKGVSIVTGTPGRVYDHIEHGTLNTRGISFLVLDEADRMLDMGFIGQVLKIIRTLPKNRITLLFSATIPPEVKRICTDYMRNPVTVEIESQTKTVDEIQQVYYRVNHNEKRTQLNRLLITEQPESCIIFCNTRIAVDQVQSFLTKKGYASYALHGDIAQNTRLKTMQQFKQGEFHILVATDVAARGIHIDDLSLVINYDIPVEKDSYIHRIGRTGRAGNGGRAISLVTGDDLMTMYEIEEHIGALIEEAQLPTEETFNQRMSEAEQWLQANALKIKPQSNQREGSGENRQRRSSGRQRTENARAGQPAAKIADNQNRDASQNRPATAEGQRKTRPVYNASRNRVQAEEQKQDVSQPARNGRNTDRSSGSGRKADTNTGFSRSNQQAEAGTQAINNRSSGQTRRQSPRQSTGVSPEGQYAQNSSNTQTAYNRHSRQTEAFTSAYSGKQSGETSHMQPGYSSRHNSPQASQPRTNSIGYHPGQQADARKPYTQGGTRTMSSQVSHRKPANITGHSRGQTDMRAEDQRQATVSKKEPLIKRIFYRLFGK
ncbi:MAG: DEAD/DEAH box helicase [Thermoclostridium sp.]|nr:DEAD/DEAH box helicase [Thermoclostridium sp.]